MRTLKKDLKKDLGRDLRKDLKNGSRPRAAKKVVRGATRSKKSFTFDQCARWARFAICVCVVGVSGYGLSLINWDALANKIHSTTYRPLANVKIEGEFNFVSQQQLQDMLLSKLDGSFVDLDLREVKAALESNPWIDYVAIERIWPDSLKIRVVEHKPIARWNTDAYINHDGRLVKVDSNSRLAHLPLLSGADGKSTLVAENYVFFSNLLKNGELKITAIKLDEKMSWDVEINNEFSLILGNNDIHKKVENFKHIYDAHLHKSKEKISRIDMRYESGMAVQWKKGSEAIAAAR